MNITRLQIMLPYFNDIYEVGEPIQFYNQVSDPNTQARRTKHHGIVKSIKWKPNREHTTYQIEFESGDRMTITDTPVQVDIEEVAE